MIPNLAEFQINPDRGYLPEEDPPLALPATVAAWDEMIEQLPGLLADKRLGPAAERMPLPDHDALDSRELGRAKLILSMLAQAYVWEPVFHNQDDPPRKRLPEQVARPLIEISSRLDEPPILNYADYVLRNWRRLDPDRPPGLENLTTLVTFSDRDDEKMFAVDHVAYEYVAGTTLTVGWNAMRAAKQGDTEQLDRHLVKLAERLRAMKRTFLAVKDIVSPEIFRNYIRLYLKGWKNNTPVAYADLIPSGQAQYRGETGSQSSVVPFFDALLGIHDQDERQQRNLESEWKGVQEAVVAEYRDFRNYMPRGHRDFIRAVERESRVREVVKANHGNPVLIASYNACVEGVADMRRGHKSTVDPYISEPGAGSPGYGTGGSDYRQYLGALYAITASSQLIYGQLEGQPPG